MIGCSGDGGCCSVAMVGGAIVVVVGLWSVVDEFCPIQRKRERERERTQMEKEER